MKKNLTLTVDDKLLRAARKIALERDTSVNELVRQYLTQLIESEDRQKTALEDIRKIFKTTRARLGPVTWSREDLYER